MSGELFHEENEGIVQAHDLAENFFPVSVKDLKFRISTYGILKDHDQLLVVRHPQSATYGLPGGQVELGESIRDALVREFKDETGLEVKVLDLIDVVEDYYSYEGGNAQSVMIIFTVCQIGGEVIAGGNLDDKEHGEDTAEVLWQSLDELKHNKMQFPFRKLINRI